MQVRRCCVFWLEPREVAHFDLAELCAGGTGVVAELHWHAHAPQLSAPVRLEAAVAHPVAALSPHAWVEADEVRTAVGAEGFERLLAAGLLVCDDAAYAEQRRADERYRALPWHGLASLWHAGSRWEGIDAAAEVANAGMQTARALRQQHGPPPAELHARGTAQPALPLPRSRTSLDDLFDARSTCRNFDTAQPLPLAAFAHVLERTYGVRGQVHAADDFEVIKKTSPSGGALHPTEAYVIARDVAGLAPGLYHYRAGEHALQPLPFDGEHLPPGAEKHAVSAHKTPLEYLAWIAVGGQQWFADAHALVVMAPRFARNYWKYRNHPKAYRVCILDVGHLSQTLLLTATELGLGAYITAAINEVDIERAFGLTHYVDGPLAVCGFGPRADTMVTSEFDPNRRVWPQKA